MNLILKTVMNAWHPWTIVTGSSILDVAAPMPYKGILSAYVFLSFSSGPRSGGLGFNIYMNF